MKSSKLLIEIGKDWATSFIYNTYFNFPVFKDQFNWTFRKDFKKEFIDFIKDICINNKFAERTPADIILYNENIVIKNIPFPKISNNKLHKIIEMEVRQHLGFNDDMYVYTFNKQNIIKSDFRFSKKNNIYFA